MFPHLKNIFGHKVKKFESHFSFFSEGGTIQIIKECVTVQWASLHEKLRVDGMNNALESNVNCKSEGSLGWGGEEDKGG